MKPGSRRLPRAWLRSDDPAYPPGPPHWLEQGRLVARPIAVAQPRSGAPRLPQKKSEDWDIERIIGDYCDAAERMQAADSMASNCRPTGI